MTPGTLVSYARDPRPRIAASLYVVLGKAGRDGMRNPQMRIQCVAPGGGSFLPWTGMTTKPLLARASELTPLAAFGYRIRTLSETTHEHGVIARFMQIEFDRALPITTDLQWSQYPPPYGEKSSSIEGATLFRLIKKAWLDAYVDTRKVA